jgi:trigger factor
MQSQIKKLDDTQVQFMITAAEADLSPYKQAALNKLSSQVKLPGFRQGTAPLNLVEKNVDQQLLQTEFLDIALSNLYAKAANIEKVRPVTRPEVSLKKFVPFTELVFEVKAHIIGKIKLPDYKNIKLAKKQASVTADDVNKVVESLRTRLSEKTEVKRAAKDGDQAWIDFKGIDDKGEPVKGADGKDYPLLLGSNTFIPGFEENVIGLKAGDEKTFDITFPKDYHVKALASKKVTFTISVKKVEEVKKPKTDDEFAKKAGPFKALKDLKTDIKKQLEVERQGELNRQYQNELIGKITDKTPLKVPQPMIEHQAEHSLEETRRNLTYRGQTYQEFLDAEGLTDEQYKETIIKPQAERQIKTSMILSEIAEAENLSVTPEELEIRIQILKGQYQDEKMQAELDKPENRQDIASRMLTEKVLAKLERYTQKQ